MTYLFEGIVYDNNATTWNELKYLKYNLSNKSNLQNKQLDFKTYTVLNIRST